jgi:hypothetical protein
VKIKKIPQLIKVRDYNSVPFGKAQGTSINSVPFGKAVGTSINSAPFGKAQCPNILLYHLKASLDKGSKLFAF